MTYYDTHDSVLEITAEKYGFKGKCCTFLTWPNCSKEALDVEHSALDEKSLLVVAGSLYLASELRLQVYEI